MSDFARRRWLPQHPTTPDAGAAQSLTSSYVTLGSQFDVASAGQLSIKMRHKATAGAQTMSFILYESDDGMDVAEEDSVWHRVGMQTDTAGALAEEQFEYTSNAAADTNWRGMVSLVLPIVAKKMRIQVKSASNLGQALASIGFLPIV